MPVAAERRTDVVIERLSPVPVLRAEALGNVDRKALCQSLNQPDHKPVEPVGRAERGQRVHTDELADHHGIHHGVHLLKHVAEHQRQGKGENQLCRPSLRHVPNSCHTNPFPPKDREDGHGPPPPAVFLLFPQKMGMVSSYHMFSFPARREKGETPAGSARGRRKPRRSGKAVWALAVRRGQCFFVFRCAG